MSEKTEHYESLLRGWVKERLAVTLKEPVGCLKHPFVDPGSVYDGNLWDWDSFWAVYGILNLLDEDGSYGGLHPSSGRRWTDYAEGNIQNFFDHQEEDGYIPMMVEAKDELPYLIRKHREGALLNMHKPFLARQIALISGYKKSSAWALRYKAGLEAYFRRYQEDYYFPSSGLYVWADDVMIGMDNDPASFGRPRFSTANLFLNSFMVSELEAAASLFRSWGDGEGASSLDAKALALSQAIRAECWDRRDRFFYSVDVDIKTRSYDWFHQGLGVFWKTLPIKVRAWTGFLPLWAGIASEDEAAALESHIRDEGTFWAPHGVCSLAKDERMFDLRVTNNPSNWLGPLWLVTQYCVFRGLLRYGFRSTAQELCDRTLTLLGTDLERTGTLHEYYDPFTGEPIMNGGFINWNILALNMVDELAGKLPMEDLIGGRF